MSSTALRNVARGGEQLHKELTLVLSRHRFESDKLMSDWEKEFKSFKKAQSDKHAQLSDRLIQMWSEGVEDLEDGASREGYLTTTSLPNEPLEMSTLAAARKVSSPSDSPVRKAWEEIGQAALSEKQGDTEPDDHEVVEIVPRKISSQKLLRSQSTMSVAVENADGILQVILFSAWFRALCSTVILLNSIFMAFHTHYSLTSLIVNGQPVGHWWEIMEQCFCAFFLFELLIRLFGMRSKFFCSDEAPWNAFDTFLVTSSSIDFITSFQSGDTETVNLTFARTLRILRFARILRVIRVMRFFHSFRLMVYSILYSVVSLLWVCLLLLFIMYCFASVFLHGVLDHFQRLEGLPEIAIEDELSSDLKEMFGSVPVALRTLFMGISGGRDWIEMMSPLNELSAVYGWLFLFYVFFMIFGVLNVVIGIFVDSSSEISRNDRQIVTQNEMDRNKAYAQSLRRFFREADTDRSNSLSWEEFEFYLKDDRVKAYFQSFELDVSQARNLFNLLDVDGSNNVEIDEFVQGCLRLKGTARSIDVNMLLYKNEKMLGMQKEFINYARERFQQLEQFFDGQVSVASDTV